MLVGFPGKLIVDGCGEGSEVIVFRHGREDSRIRQDGLDGIQPDLRNT
jgi:hypothetical protein